jgi:acetoin utilization deacetylase AcuC-like enzyme
MINVFYRKEQTANVDVFSPSPRKPALVVDAWLKQFPDQIKINSFKPVTLNQLCEVHDREYILGVLSGTELNGFGTYDIEVAESLPYTSGSMLAAAEYALEHGIAVSPTSGFHHASYYNGGGYCTINGLMVTAVALLDDGLADKVGIIDLDQHYGNGTDDIIKKLQLEGYVKHFTAGANYHNINQVTKFIARLPNIIKNMSNCDVILCQLGADPHVNDPLGGWLTTDNMRKRDRIVFETCKELGIPLAFNLAGGYQTPISKVVQLHVNTMAECLAVYEDVYA